MTLTRQTLHRLPTIKQGLLSGLTTAQIGNKLGVYEKTIDRDLRAFVDSGEFEAWIKEEWLRLHNIILHEDPVEAYRNVSRLVGQMLTHKVKSEELRVEEIRILWQEQSNSKSDTPPTQVNENSITTDTASECFPVDGDGEKPKQAQTKP